MLKTWFFIPLYPLVQLLIIFLYRQEKIENQATALLSCVYTGCPRLSSFSKWSFPTDVTRKQNTCEGTEQLLLTNLSHVVSPVGKKHFVSLLPHPPSLPVVFKSLECSLTKNFCWDRTSSLLPRWCIALQPYSLFCHPCFSLWSVSYFPVQMHMTSL